MSFRFVWYVGRTILRRLEPVFLSCHIHWAHWWWWCRAVPQKVCFSPILPGVDCSELSVVAADLWFLQSCSRLSGMRAPLTALFFPCVDLEKLRKLPQGLRPRKGIPDLWLEWIFNLIGFLLPWASVLPVEMYSHFMNSPSPRRLWSAVIVLQLGICLPPNSSASESIQTAHHTRT